ncbi:T9SS type A sorting domain-containing protein [bacterium SCSIO 12741]|nr:T9SS type A sorting domain-containing protein [bacterium SCSIO 12741]
MCRKCRCYSFWWIAGWGTYFGSHVSSGKFSPISAGVGTHIVYYTYSDGAGCSDTASQTIEVLPSPTVTLANINAVCIDAAAFALSGGSPAGGTYKGTGVSGGQFNPATAGAGTHTITYVYTNANNCTDSASTTVTVNPLPTVTFSALSPTCVGTAAFALSGGSPAGGTYSGTGVSGGQFNPATAGVGTHTITYTYTDGNSCTNSATQTITVNPQPTVTLNPFAAVCAGDAAFALSGGSPAGGTYSGTGVSGGQFNPTTAGAGTHTITYNYTDGNNCSSSATQSITVHAQPNVTLANINAVCIDAAAFALSGGSPVGGTYKGTGVSGGQFNPATAGAGTHTITYVYTNANNCTDSASTTVTVNPLPTVTFSALTPTCVGTAAFALSGGSPVGGTYSGTGVSGGQFNPATAGVGTHTITYTYTDGNSCANSATQTITVNPQPTVTLNPFAAVCAGDAAFALSGGSPAGGTYSGAGVSGGQFNPTTAGAGTHTITYNYTDGNNCSSSATQSITVHAQPNVTLANINAVCIDAAAFALSGGSPAGGTYKGTGVSGGQFNPATAGAGTHTITYVYTNANNCTDSASTTVTVNPLPTVTFSALSPTCVGTAAFALSGGSPAGGTYSGTGVSGGQFNPATAGVGTHTITYTFTDGNSCANSATQTITVNPQPTVTLNPFAAVCAGDAAFALSGGSPAGGTYSGTGVSGGQFNPTTAGAGTHTITYNYTDGNNCSSSATQSITVHAQPNVTLANINAVCIDAAAFALSGGSPAGGTYKGTGVSGGQFNPATAGAGTHTITYVYTNANNCTDSASTTVTVNPLPTVTFSALTPTCVGTAAFALSGGSPAGGTYSGTGVSGGQFNPATAGVGTHTITYTYTDGNSCTNSTTQTITVNPQPTVTLNPFAAVCAGDAAFALSGGSPAGGTYSGAGVSGGQFNPTTAGAGTHTITYIYTDGNNCSSSATQSITVHAQPNVTLANINAVCIDAAAFVLSGGSPAGGTYKGTGVSGGQFNPATAGAGTHTITYVYTNANNCTDSASTTVTVNPLPTVTFSALSSTCVGTPAFALSGGSPAGGTYSGTGVSGGQFNPATAGVGTHTITYTYTDGNSCTNSATQTITVNPQPTVTLNPFAAVCAGDAAFALSGGSPAGGTYSGTGVSGGQFNPTTAGAGTHTITYSYTDRNNCSSSTTQTITVHGQPTVTIPTFANRCENGTILTLTGATPVGGTYKGTGVSAGQFDPNVAKAGTHTITYVYTDANSCTDSASSNLKVDTVPVINYPALADICSSSPAVNINTATPPGGTYKGNGVILNSQFDPQITGIGTFTIWYVFTDGNSCTDSASQTIKVDVSPSVNFQLVDSLCVNGSPLTLSATPAGGTFSGSGVSGNQFDPQVAGVGKQYITYSYTLSNGCSNSLTDSIRIDSLTAMTFALADSICQNASPITLSASPIGVSYLGNGVTGNQFNPSGLTPGVNTVSCTYTNSFGCKDTLDETIRIDSVPVIQLPGWAALCSRDTLILTGGLPAGGNYSGPQVTGSVFYGPAAPGKYPVSYLFTNSFGCSDSLMDSIEVKSLPSISLGTVSILCENTPDFVIKTGSPAGGSYLGAGVVKDSIFSATLVGSGSTTLGYRYTDTSGCTDTVYTTWNVDTLPNVTFGPIPDLCENGGRYTLIEGMPTGGNYMGTGVAGGTQFDPSLGFGDYNLKYAFVDGNGCTDTTGQQVHVDTVERVQSFTPQDLCFGSAPVILTSGLPTGGVYHGQGVIQDTVFVPAGRPAGTQTIFYSVSSRCGSDTLAAQFELHQLPQASIDSLPLKCQGDPELKLAPYGHPAGGSFYVDGIKRTTLVSGELASSFDVAYEITDTLGCTNSALRRVDLLPFPDATIEGNIDWCSSDTVRLIVADTSHAYYIWNNDTLGATFEKLASAFELGNHSIDLKVVDEHGCYQENSALIRIDNCSDDLSLFPNPNNGKFQVAVELDAGMNITLSVVNSVGQEILKEDTYAHAGRNLYDIELMDGSGGTYVLRIRLEDGTLYMQKLVVQE